jgi:hypothetical protein
LCGESAAREAYLLSISVHDWRRLMGGCSIIRLQEEANRWQAVAEFAFFLRHPELLSMPFSAAVSRSEFHRFRRFGQELHILEWDLTQCLNEFKQSYEVLYRAEHLALKKFSIVYHADNFNVRVHKVNESVEALLALLGGIDPKRRSRRGEPSRRELVEDALKRDGRGAALKLIRRFRERPPITRAIEARNVFVHIYRDEPECDWRGAMLTPADRIRHLQRADDPFERGLRRIVDTPHVDAYADTQADELLAALEDVRQLRDDLYGVLLGDLSALVATRPEEARQHFRWVLEWNEVWREILSGLRSENAGDVSS